MMPPTRERRLRAAAQQQQTEMEQDGYGRVRLDLVIKAVEECINSGDITLEEYEEMFRPRLAVRY